jgi:hypothetical protein
MKILYKWIILIAILFTALIFYSYGFSQSATVFIVLGVALECVFWFGVFDKKTRRSKLVNSTINN